MFADRLTDFLERGFTPIPLNPAVAGPHELPVRERRKKMGDDYRDLTHIELAEAVAGFPKKPAIPTWRELQSRDVSDQEFEDWCERFPSETNIGLVTGKTFIVIDADSEEAVHFVETELSHTPVRVSTSQGMHFYYTKPDFDIRNSVGRNKIDIRGTGGYVVAAGSVHSSGVIYEWSALCPDPHHSDMGEITLADVAAIKAYNRGEDAPAVDIVPLEEGGFGFDPTAYEPIQNLPFEVPQEGSRNNDYARLAGSLLARGYPEDLAWTLLRGVLAFAHEAGDDFPEAELVQVFESIRETHRRNNPTWEPRPIEEPLELGLDDPKWRSKLIVDWDDEPEVIDMIVDGMIQGASLGSIFGPPKSMKTYLAVNLAAHVATGTPWYGQKVKRCRVMIVCGEGVAGIKNRLRAAGRMLNQRLQGPVVLMPYALKPNSIDGMSRVISELVNLERSGDPVGLIIWDTLARTMEGSENDATDMNSYIAAMDSLRERFGVTNLVIHHTPKTSDGNPTPRGHGSFHAALDFGLFVKKVQEDDRPRLTINGDGFCKEFEAPNKTLTFESVRLREAIDDQPEVWTLANRESLLPVFPGGDVPKSSRKMKTKHDAMTGFVEVMQMKGLGDVVDWPDLKEHVKDRFAVGDSNANRAMRLIPEGASMSERVFVGGKFYRVWREKAGGSTSTSRVCFSAG
ncbi:AAA family ATPase [Ferrimonas balearica]|uniref:AAA family ATPase n=1 Tax=Ferrimonas balearica TaxID=44012 RepID=UPI001C98F7F1|nr:AAA family ATPase [Ferrimonas balearica]MBY5992494.1 AAA family ATPase [Ferrimonas balearica]